MKYLKIYKVFESIFEPEYLDTEDWLKLLSRDFIEKIHEKKWGKTPSTDLSEMLYYLDPWDYIDDDKFVEQYIDAEIESGVSDFGYMYDSTYDKKEKLIPYLENIYDEADEKHIIKYNKELFDIYVKEQSIDVNESPNESEDGEEPELTEIEELYNRIKDEEGYIWILEELENDIIKDLVNSWGDCSDIVEEDVRDRYKNMDAKDVLSEFHTEDVLNDTQSFFSERNENNSNILYYLDEEKMKNDVPEYEDSEIDDNMNGLNLIDEDEIQKEIFKEHPEKILDMFESDIVGEE